MGNALEDFAATLPDADRQVLHGAAVFVMEIVANADSDRDNKEVDTIAKLRDVVRERMGAAFAASGSDFPDVVAAAADPEWLQGEHVRKLAAVVRRMPEGARKLFDRTLIEIGLSVGGASGGFFGLGNKLSDHEQYAIKRLAGALQLEIDADLKKSLG